MRLAVLFLVLLGACSANESEIVPGGMEPKNVADQLAVAATAEDSAAFYLSKIDSATATEADLQRARPYFIEASTFIRQDAARLMKAGLVLMSGEQDQLYGVNYLILLTKKFPEHPYAPEALMQLALYFENSLNDKARSSAFLRTLVDRYPNHGLVPNANALLALNGGGEKEELETVKNWLNNK